MKENVRIQSLQEFKRNRGEQSSSLVQANAADVEKTGADITALSPAKSGNGANVSQKTRNHILSFAHPIDAGIVKALDNPAVNSVFNKVVQTSIDASWGLALATGIRVGPNTYPEIYEIVVECAQTLGMPIPYVFISDQVNGINACTAGTNQFSFIALSSILPLLLNRDELKFVIGHEFGHLALGHVVYHTAINMAGSATGLIPFVGEIISKTITFPLNAWSRRSEISADRAGLVCCGDINVAMKTLLKLQAGFMNIQDIDIDEYIRESESVLNNSALGKLSEVVRSHPIIPKRIKALQMFYNSTVYADAIGVIMTATDNKLLSRESLAVETEKIVAVM